MKKIALFVLLCLAPMAASAVCTQATSGLGLCYPNFGDSGSVWAAAIRNNFVMLNSSVPIVTSTPTYSAFRATNWIVAGSSIAAGAGFYGSGAGLTALPGNKLDGTNVTADTMTVTGPSFSVGGSTLVVANGRVGVGTNIPQVKLSVLQADNEQTPMAVFNANNLTRGLGIAYDGIISTGSSASVDISISAKGTGQTWVGGHAFGTGVRFNYTDANNMVYFGAVNPTITADSGKVISIGQVLAATGGLNINTTTNNVGIGTTAPGAKLEVAGQVYQNSAGTKMLFKSPDGTCSACGPDNSDVWACASVACP